MIKKTRKEGVVDYTQAERYHPELLIRCYITSLRKPKLNIKSQKTCKTGSEIA